MTERRKRLIEVAFPLEEVSAHSRREKNIRHGHISTLHIWWARRPLAACRAVIYASLVDDPGDDTEREELLKEIADLANWDAVRKPDQVVRSRDKGGSGLTGAQLLERARRRILADNGGKPPRLLDPFAGGGAIPLEGLRLGCEVEASDLNPVAVLILKGTVEYPQKYGRPNSREVPAYTHEAAQSRNGHQFSFADGDLVTAYRKNPLATDVRYWGNWMLERARVELAEFYPPDSDGSVPVAYLWSRTVPCPNCAAEMPLIRQYWLARKDKKKVALKPVLDRDNNRVDFEVVEGPDVTGDPGEATTSRGDTLCLLCRQVVKAEYVRQVGKAAKLDQVMTAVVLEAQGRGGKRYRKAKQSDLVVSERAAERLEQLNEIDGLPAVPDEPVPYDPRKIDIELYGLDQWGKLFNSRQLVALTTFSRLVREAHAEMLRAGLDEDYAKVVATYLGLAVDRTANRLSTSCTWDVGYEKIVSALALQALPMKWDFAEANPLSGSSGGFDGAFEGIAEVVEANSFNVIPGCVVQRDARNIAASTDFILTDPPYYDSINYGHLADFFYVWLKRSVGFLYPDAFELPVTPKKQQIVMNIYADSSEHRHKDRNSAARRNYVEGMAEASKAMNRSLRYSGMASVVFAHTDPDAWSVLIEGLLQAGLVPHASWPIDTEIQTGMKTVGQARLKTSVWMACRPRDVDAGEAFLGDVLLEMRPVIRERLLYFWSKGIRGADFFISAIGPALSVFGRHSRVLRPDGSEVTVREFLDLVRRESTQVALEQVLQGADFGVVDPITSHYVTWVWSYSRAPLDTGEAIALCLATGADYKEIVRPGSIAIEAREKSKKLAKLRSIRERGLQDENLGEDSPARPAPLIDQLQHAAHLWSLNRPDDLAMYRAQLGETRWTALRTLGQAVAECLPNGDEDRRLINGLLGSNIMAVAAPGGGMPRRSKAGMEIMPGFGDGE